MNDGRQSLRTFFAIWPDDTVRAELWQRAAFAAKACGGRATRSDLLHLTLVFIGTTSRDRVADLVSLMDTIDTPAFVLDLDCSGWFRQNGIVWAGTRSTSEPLIALQCSRRRPSSTRPTSPSRARTSAARLPRARRASAC